MKMHLKIIELLREPQPNIPRLAQQSTNVDIQHLVFSYTGPEMFVHLRRIQGSL